jgi:hypothetical protein
VPVGVIDLLEVVQIDHQAGQRGVGVAGHSCVLLTQPEFDVAPVGDAGQVVGQRERLGRGPGPFQVGQPVGGIRRPRGGKRLAE